MSSKIRCMICGEEFKRISNTHLLRKHRMTMEEYIQKFPDAPIDAPGLADDRVAHLRGKTYVEIYGDDKGQELKKQRSDFLASQWEKDPKKIEIKKIAEEKLQEKIDNPALIGRPRLPSNHMNSVCVYCGKEFEYNSTDRKGMFCSQECYIQYSRLEASDYRIKAFAHFEAKCDICAETEKKLVVHHRDKNRANNSLSNLQILCGPCHSLAHADSRRVARNGGISEDALQAAVLQMLQVLRVDVRDENFVDTPRRITKAYLEIFEGMLPSAKEELEKHLSTAFPCEYNEIILVKDIRCWSMCPHHFLPVKYSIDLAYIPKNAVLGISKLPRLVTLLAKRPVLQEQLTEDIANYLEKYVDPRGIAIKVSGQHLCMQMRGVKAVDSDTITSCMRGSFMNEPEARQEFFSLVNK